MNFANAPSGSLILVTGGTGAVGSRLIARLRDRGLRIRVLCLAGDAGAEAARTAGADIVEGDITRPETLPPAFAGVDSVLHMAALILSPRDPDRLWTVNCLGTRNIVLAAEQAGIRHLVHVSSASVTYSRSNSYSRSKAAAEEAVKVFRGHWTIVRPTLVFGDRGGLEFLHFVEHLKRFPIVPFIGSGRARKRPVHVDDLVLALAAIPGNPVAFGKTYNLAGAESLSLRRMAEILLERMGTPKRIIPLPVPLCRAACLLNGLLSRLTGSPPLLTPQTIMGFIEDADLDPLQAMEDLGWKPRGFSDPGFFGEFR